MHWAFDTYMLAHSTGGALVKAGGDTWYFITADYAFGHALQRDTTQFIEAAGGKVLGSAALSVPCDDRFLRLSAAGAGPRREGGRLRQAGADTINSIKQAREFGLAGTKITLAAMLVFIADIHAGAETAQGLTLLRDLLLGPQRPHPRLPEAHRARRCRPTVRPEWGMPATIPHAALPEGGRRHGRRGGEDERARRRSRA